MFINIGYKDDEIVKQFQTLAVFMLTNCTHTQIQSNTDIRAVPYGRRWDKLFVVDSKFSFIFCLVSFGLLWHLNFYVQ